MYGVLSPPLDENTTTNCFHHQLFLPSSTNAYMEKETTVVLMSDHPMVLNNVLLTAQLHAFLFMSCPIADLLPPGAPERKRR